jgi:hypothetical protein
MPQWLASLIAALIGASVGSIGAVLASGALKPRAELSERREALVQRVGFVNSVLPVKRTPHPRAS